MHGQSYHNVQSHSIFGVLADPLIARGFVSSKLYKLVSNVHVLQYQTESQREETEVPVHVKTLGAEHCAWERTLLVTMTIATLCERF